MTDEQALETYIHNEDSYESDQEDRKCCECESFIGLNERYYEVDGQTYCPDCMDDLFGHWN